jgi:NADH-quinone oxidoreductase subunit L
MFLACGVGAYSVAIFHLATHAFFKALLFLGAGSVIHGVSDDQDMRRMGGLKKYMPRTRMTMLIGCLAIAGIPPLAGFFSKDAILENVFAGGHYILFAVGLVTAGLTAFYMFRLYFMTFDGKERMSEEVKSHLHESPPSMVLPLVVLAVFTVFIGFLSVPLIQNGDRFGDFLKPVFAESQEVRSIAAASHDVATGVISSGGHGDAAHPVGHHLPVAVELALMALSVLVAGIGIFIAYRHYVANISLSAGLAERLRGAYRTLLNKYYVDEIYRVVVVRPLERISSWLWRIFDVRLIDGVVDGVGGVVVTAGTILRLFQNGYVGTYAFFFVLGVVILIAQLVMN